MARHQSTWVSIKGEGLVKINHGRCSLSHTQQWLKLSEICTYTPELCLSRKKDSNRGKLHEELSKEKQDPTAPKEGKGLRAPTHLWMCALSPAPSLCPGLGCPGMPGTWDVCGWAGLLSTVPSHQAHRVFKILTEKRRTLAEMPQRQARQATWKVWDRHPSNPLPTHTRCSAGSKAKPEFHQQSPWDEVITSRLPLVLQGDDYHTVTSVPGSPY